VERNRYKDTIIKRQTKFDVSSEMMLVEILILLEALVLTPAPTTAASNALGGGGAKGVSAATAATISAHSNVAIIDLRTELERQREGIIEGSYLGPSIKELQGIQKSDQKLKDIRYILFFKCFYFLNAFICSSLMHSYSTYLYVVYRYIFSGK